MSIASLDTTIYQSDNYKSNRVNSMSHVYTSPCIPPSTHHVIQFQAPDSEAINTLGSKKLSKDARHAVKKRREAQRGNAKDGAYVSGSKEKSSKTVCKLKSGSPTRGRSRERSGKIKKFIRRSLSLKKASNVDSCLALGCNTDGTSVCTGSTTGSMGSSFFSRLGSSRRSKSRDSVCSASSWGSRKWRKWRKSRRDQTPEKKQTVHSKQTSPTEVSDFVESRSRGYEEKSSNWLCASMEPVIICQDYFCANEDEEELIGKVIGTENNGPPENNRPPGILRNAGPKNHVRFHDDDDYRYCTVDT